MFYTYRFMFMFNTAGGQSYCNDIIFFMLWKHNHTTHQSVTLTLSDRPSPDTLQRKIISSTG